MMTIFLNTSTETPDTLNFVPININMPAATNMTNNNSMQYAMFSLKEKQVTLPDRLDEPR
jgi:hypothetical protein